MTIDPGAITSHVSTTFQIDLNNKMYFDLGIMDSKSMFFQSPDIMPRIELILRPKTSYLVYLKVNDFGTLCLHCHLCTLGHKT